jgi:hypothetical protein
LQRLLDELLDITAEASMLSEIKDIHDELEMLRDLFDTQLKVLGGKMIVAYTELR